MNSKEDQLIKIAKQNLKEAKDTSGLDEVRLFFIALKLKEGRKKVTSRHLYNAYTVWSPHPLSKTAFFLKLAQVIPCYRKAAYRYYLLNYSSWEIEMRCREIRDQYVESKK